MPANEIKEVWVDGQIYKIDEEAWKKDKSAVFKVRKNWKPTASDLSHHEILLEVTFKVKDAVEGKSRKGEIEALEGVILNKLPIVTPEGTITHNDKVEFKDSPEGRLMIFRDANTGRIKNVGHEDNLYDADTLRQFKKKDEIKVRVGDRLVNLAGTETYGINPESGEYNNHWRVVHHRDKELEAMGIRDGYWMNSETGEVRNMDVIAVDDLKKVLAGSGVTISMLIKQGYFKTVKGEPGLLTPNKDKIDRNLGIKQGVIFEKIQALLKGPKVTYETVGWYTHPHFFGKSKDKKHVVFRVLNANDEKFASNYGLTEKLEGLDEFRLAVTTGTEQIRLLNERLATATGDEKSTLVHKINAEEAKKKDAENNIKRIETKLQTEGISLTKEQFNTVAAKIKKINKGWEKIEKGSKDMRKEGKADQTEAARLIDEGNMEILEAEGMVQGNEQSEEGNINWDMRMVNVYGHEFHVGDSVDALIAELNKRGLSVPAGKTLSHGLMI